LRLVTAGALRPHVTATPAHAASLGCETAGHRL